MYWGLGLHKFAPKAGVHMGANQRAEHSRFVLPRSTGIVEMPNQVTINTELGIIEVNAYGIVLRSEMEEAIEEIHRIHQEEGINKILADTTKVERGPSTLDTFEIWSQYPRGFKHAIWLGRSEMVRKDVQFIENIRMNRAQQTRAFETREEALQWLLKE